MRHLRLVQGGSAVQENVNSGTKVRTLVDRDLILCFSELWPNGALLTQEAASLAKPALAPEGAQFAAMDPALAGLTDYEEVLTEACVRPMLEAYARLK